MLNVELRIRGLGGLGYKWVVTVWPWAKKILQIGGYVFEYYWNIFINIFSVTIYLLLRRAYLYLLPA